MVIVYIYKTYEIALKQHYTHTPLYCCCCGWNELAFINHFMKLAPRVQTAPYIRTVS